MDTDTISNIKGKIVKKHKPWGYFINFINNKPCTVKLITLNPNESTSKQSHKKRVEIWLIIDDGLQIEIDNKVLKPKVNEIIIVPKKIVHRITSLGMVCRIIEISLGRFDEDDIERFDDNYNRHNSLEK
jgi:mannose-6-phosphate isomerase